MIELKILCLLLFFLKCCLSEEICVNATLSYLFDNCVSCPTCGSSSSGSLYIENLCANQGDITNFNISIEVDNPDEPGGVYDVDEAYLDDLNQLIQNAAPGIITFDVSVDGSGDFQFSIYNILFIFGGDNIIMNDGVHAPQTCFNCYDNSGTHQYTIVKSSPTYSGDNHLLLYVDGIIAHACETITLDYSNNRTFDFSYANEEGLWKFALYLSGLTSNAIFSDLYGNNTGFNKHVNNICFDNETLVCEVDGCSAQFVTLTERIIAIHDFFNGGGTNLTISIVFEFLQSLNLNITNLIEKTNKIYDCTCGTNCNEWYDLWTDCKNQNRCDCRTETWNVSQCVDITCWGINFLDSNVCNGNGVCIGFNKCRCRDGYDGDQCEKDCT